MKTSSDDLVSIIIPNFNYGIYIDQAVCSVLNQTYSNIEIIVVDDGSTDDSVEKLKKYGDKIKLFETENHGSCVARNLGLLKSSGNFIAYLDSDDYWDEEKIELQLMFLKKSEADLVFCEMISTGVPSNIKHIQAPKVINHDWFIKNPTSTPFSPSSVLMTQDLAEKVGSWNTSLTGPAEDFDYFRKCAKFGKIRGLKRTLVYHREHAESLTSISSRKYFEDNLRVVRLMLVEDFEKISTIRGVSIWLKVRINYIKHAIKTRDFLLLIQIIGSSLK